MIVLALLAQQVYVHYAFTGTNVKGGINQAHGAVQVTARRPKRNGAPADADKDPAKSHEGDESGAGPATQGWPPRDMLAPFVLLAVSMQRAHGYVIEDYLRALGVFGITMSTLYRTLRQMEKDGYLDSSWEPGPTGPARRVYTLTDAGRAGLDASATMLDAYRQTIDRFFGLYTGAFGSRPPVGRDPTADRE
jgi:PadR family transcriptional regulator, regulatory protein PadR